MSSPRAWGCFGRIVRYSIGSAVFPTCVGVFRYQKRAALLSGRLPHVRGGVSKMRFVGKGVKLSSPRAWGCFEIDTADDITASVFPTCVGVFPAGPGRSAPAGRLPHVRGGVSVVESRKRILDPSSPRAWGCFRHDGHCHEAPSVFPTCVGVFPVLGQVVWVLQCLPHVRGGVSTRLISSPDSCMSSPRAWGCF